MATPNEGSSETNLPGASQDSSSLTDATPRDPGPFYATRGAIQGDGGMRPGDWLVLLIGLTLIVGLALVVLGTF